MVSLFLHLYKDLITTIILLVNFIAFIFHKTIYKKPKSKVRRIWGLSTIAVGITIIIFQLPAWLHGGVEVLFSPFFVFFLCCSGVIMLTLNRSINLKMHIALMPVIYVIYFLFVWSLGHTLQKEILRFMPFSCYFICSAILFGVIYLLIISIWNKPWRANIRSAIQVALVANLAPYISWGWFSPQFENSVMALTCYLVIFLPEILGFTGLVLLKKHRIVSGILLAIGIIIAVEVVPIRMFFWLDESVGYLMSQADRAKMKRYDNLDRQSEFKRSLRIIDNLGEMSKSIQSRHKARVVIFRPNFVEKPYFLSVDTVGFAYWEVFGPDSAKTVTHQTVLIDTTLDSDRDGLSDFREAEMLSDAYDPDTDGDGFNDAEDSDPLNPYHESKYAAVYAGILDFMSAYFTFPFFIINGNFYEGRGEIGNFTKHVIVLHPNQVDAWNVIFGEQYTEYGQRSLFGQYISFSKYRFDLLGELAVVGFIRHHGIWADSSGFLYLLVKWKGRWKVIGMHQLWF